MRVAVFIDAGYLYAAGSSSIVGHGRINRRSVDMDRQAIIAKLTELAKTQALSSEYLYRSLCRWAGVSAPVLLNFR